MVTDEDIDSEEEKDKVDEVMMKPKNPKLLQRLSICKNNLNRRKSIFEVPTTDEGMPLKLKQPEYLSLE